MPTKTSLIQHFESFFKAMKPAVIDNEEAFVWASGLNHPMYNLITHFSCANKRDAEESFDLLVKKLPSKIPHACWVHPENRSEELQDILLKRDYQLVATCPVMTWQVEPILQPSFDVCKASDKKAFSHIFTTVFQYEPALGEALITLLYSMPAEQYFGCLDGRPVGIVTLFCNGTTGVVSNLGTLAEYQQRGCGRALMLTLMNRAYELGLRELVLGSSPVAEKLYESLGFKKRISIDMYTKSYAKS